MESQLSASAAIFSAALTESNLLILDASRDPATGLSDDDLLAYYSSLPSAGELVRAFASVNQATRVADISLLTPDGRTLIRGGELVLPPAQAPAGGDDLAALHQAAEGRMAATAFRLDDPTKRVYYPVRNASGEVLAVLRLESAREDRELFERQGRRLAAAGILFSVVIVLLWLALSRLIRRAENAERFAQQSDRLRALGTTTAGIAHELRNPLGILVLGIEELQAAASRVEEQDARRDLLALADDLAGEVARLRDLTDQFLDFSRRDREEGPASSDLAAVAAQTTRLIAKGLDPGITLDFTAPTAPLVVALGERRVRQILINLLRNATEAVSGGGGRVAVTITADDGRAVVRVVDNGPGMSPDVLARIFDPFFTTRPEGTGLGLPLSRSMAESVGGTLELKSAPGRGTTAELRLPLAGNVPLD
jgi:signal transduction histidine kinase